MAFTSQTNAIPKHKTWPSLKIFKANKLRYKLQNPFILKWSEKLVKPRLKLGFLSNYTIWKKVWSFGCQSCFWKPVFASKTDNYPHSPHWQGVWNLPHQFHLYLIKICLSWQPLSGRDNLLATGTYAAYRFKVNKNKILVDGILRLTGRKIKDWKYQILCTHVS